MTIGNGPIVVLKATGEMFHFSSNPGHTHVQAANTAEQFQAALDDLKSSNDYAALHPEKLEI